MAGPATARHLGFIAGTSASDTAPRCTALPDVVAGQNRLQNGLQIFPGGVPIYRAGKLIGGVGVSGAPGGEKDEVCANAGLARVEAALK